MPKRIKSLCITPGCGGESGKKGRCDNCRNRGNLPQSASRKAYHEADGHFYSSSRWRAARLAHLSRQPLCVECQALAQAVDHIIPRAAGGADLDEKNLQSLCLACHARKTRQENPA